jgi:hypothetical protein
MVPAMLSSLVKMVDAHSSLMGRPNTCEHGAEPAVEERLIRTLRSTAIRDPGDVRAGQGLCRGHYGVVKFRLPICADRGASSPGYPAGHRVIDDLDPVALPVQEITGDVARGAHSAASCAASAAASAAVAAAAAAAAVVAAATVTTVFTTFFSTFLM